MLNGVQRLAPSLAAALTDAATIWKLDPVLVAAVVMQECGGNPFRTRFEPGYRWTFPPGAPIADPLEAYFQKTSHGAMQVMGAVVREYGYKGTPEEFRMVTDSLRYGCRLLADLLGRYEGNEFKALIAYNGGPGANRNVDPVTGAPRNKSYADSVLARRDTFKREGFV